MYTYPKYVYLDSVADPVESGQPDPDPVKKTDPDPDS